LRDLDTNSNIITPEIKSAFSLDKPQIDMREFLDENGNIKKGYELFDLNCDGKLDEYD